MQQTFSLQRWTLVVATHWAENRKKYLLSIAAYASLLFVWFVFVMMTDRSDPFAENLQEITFYFSVILVGPFYASLFFKELSSKSKGTNYLMVPASTLEKLMCSLFYVIIVFPVIIIATFYLVDAVAVCVANLSHRGYNGVVDHEGNVVRAHIANVFLPDGFNNAKILLYGILFFLAIQSAALLGSVYFPQYSYIKTAIGLTLLFLFFALIMNFFFEKLMPPGNFRGDIGQYVFYGNEGEGKNKLVKLPLWIGKAIEFLLFYGFPPVFWAATYFRLKEKEV